MKKTLLLLSKLSDQDIDWLIGSGTTHVMKPPLTLILEGEPVTSLYFTISGIYEVTRNAQYIATVGAGEVLGELSFLDSRPPVATVAIKEEGLVLTIEVARLKAKLRVDTGFASRFYLALGVMLADRIRQMESQMTASHQVSGSGEEWSEIGDDILDDSSMAAVKFQRLREAALNAGY